MENIDKTTLTTAILMGLATFLTFLLEALQSGRMDSTKAVVIVLLTGGVMAAIAFTKHILASRQSGTPDVK